MPPKLYYSLGFEIRGDDEALVFLDRRTRAVGFGVLILGMVALVIGANAIVQWTGTVNVTINGRSATDEQREMIRSVLTLVALVPIGGFALCFHASVRRFRAPPESIVNGVRFDFESLRVTDAQGNPLDDLRRVSLRKRYDWFWRTTHLELCLSDGRTIGLYAVYYDHLFKSTRGVKAVQDDVEQRVSQVLRRVADAR